MSHGAASGSPGALSVAVQQRRRADRTGAEAAGGAVGGQLGLPAAVLPGAQLELVVHKPWFTWRCQVLRPDGTPLGEITKQIRLGRARFTLLDPRGAQLGEVRAHNWRAKDFGVYDGAGQAIARVTKRWAGLRELFTDADTYVVEVSPAAVDPLRSLAVATCLVIDVVMKQKDYAD